MGRVGLVVVALAACGRLDFAQHAAQDAPAAAVDAPRDAHADAFVDPPDAQEWVCGDGVCDGSQGESCGACAADCDTTADVCGNGECGSGETSASCETDCGPSPWPFVGTEQALLAAINASRASRVVCPGSDASSNPPQLADANDAAGLVSARTMAWEYAHEPRTPANQTTCNGRTLQSLIPSGYKQGLFIRATLNPQTLVEQLELDGSGCPDIENAAVSKVTLGAADDLEYGYVLYLE